MSNRPKRRSSRGVAQRASTTSSPAATGIGGIARGTWLVILGVVIALAAGIGIALSVAGDDTATVAQTGFAETIGDKLTPYDAAVADDPAIGATIPVTRAQTFEDGLVEITPDDGKARVIGFFAHWCPVCQAELPSLTAWIDADGVPANVDVIAVSTNYDESRGNAPASEWFDDVGWPETVLRDSGDNRLASGYGLTGFPYLVAIGADGTVLDRIGGPVTQAEWNALLELAASS